MIDIHSHVLPFVDDGAKDVDDALEMLRMAQDASTTGIVLTPHSNLYQDEKNLLFELNFVFDAFKNKVANSGLNIDVFLGGEVFADNNILKLATDHLLPTINGSRFILIEFDFYSSIEYIKKTVRDLSAMGYVPIVAHPERYECIKKSPSNALAILNSGGLSQINKGSLMGDFGAGAKLCAYELLYHRLIQFVASDAHNLDFRNTDMELAFDIVCADYGEDIALKLFETNPKAVINNETLKISKPLLY